MSWKTKPLGEIIEPSGLHRAGTQDFPILSITMKQGLVDQAEKFKKRIASNNTSNYRVAYKNELVVGFPIDEGVLGFQTKYPAGIVSPAYDIWKLKKETASYIPYLERYLRSAQARNLYASRMQGAVARRRSLTKSDFVKLEIPFPPFNDQIRITQLLSKVEGLIAHRKQHLQQLDDLLKSVFLEMFGDPVRNEKGWSKKPFSELLADIDSGKSPKCEARAANNDEWGVLKLGAVTRCVFDSNENKALPQDVKPSTIHEIKAGDLLFSRKNTYELVAACAYVFETRPKLLMPDLIFRFVFREDADVNPIFMWKLLTNDSQRKAIQSFAAGAAGSMPNISKANLRTAQLPIPPLSEQDRFASIVEKLEALKSRYQKSLNDLESLYGALSQQAFKGELELSCVPLPIEHTQQNTEEADTSTSVKINIPLSDFFRIPQTANTAEVRTPEGRTTFLRIMLSAWLEQYSHKPLSLTDFMGNIQNKLWDLTDGELHLSTGDYDQIKNWLFDALKAEKLEQAYDGEDNRVQLKPRSLKGKLA